MAFGTVGPGIRMLPCKHRKETRIVFPEFCRRPARIGCVAFDAIRGYSDLLVIGFRGGIEILLMAGEAIGSDFSVIT
jgi:hypothetical protein